MYQEAVAKWEGTGALSLEIRIEWGIWRQEESKTKEKRI